MTHILKENYERLFGKKLTEARYEPPKSEKEWGKHTPAEIEDFYRQFVQYNKTITDVVRKITELSGYWYTGNASDSLVDKMKSFSPEQIKNFRNKTVELANLQRDVEKKTKEMKMLANQLIADLEKGISI